jgi:hypothetical protein
VRRTTSPNLTPLRFLRIVASEYLAAYELSGRTPVLGGTQALDFADDFLASLDDDAVGGLEAEVVDISAHPKFDPSALRPALDRASEARPQVGA